MNRHVKKFILCLLLFELAAGLIASEEKKPRLITVNGSAEVNVMPDEVIISLGVETWNKKLEIAQVENDARMRKIIAAARAHGIKDRHIQTSYLSMDPRYKDEHENKKFIGYFVQKNLALVLRDTSKFDSLLRALLEAGADDIRGVRFRTTEYRKHMDRARSMAIKAAKEKADDLAGELGQKTGRPYTIVEDNPGTRSVFLGSNITYEVDPYEASPGSIALGLIKIKAGVTVSFELESK